MADEPAVSEGTQQTDAATAAPEAPESGGDPRQTPKMAGLEAARAAARERVAGEAEEPEPEPESQPEPSPEPEAEEGLQDVRDGIPTPPEERVTEGVPEGTYREESTGRLKDATTHRYVEEPDGETVQAGGESPEGEEPGETPEAEADVPEAPEGFEMVELPPNHPLRDRGETHVPIPLEETVGEHHRQYLLSQVNNAVRSSEVEQERQRRRELERRLAEVEAEEEARQEASETLQQQRDEFLADEENRRIYEDLERAYGEERAEAWLLGELGTTEEQLTSEKKEERLSQKEWERRAAEFERELTETLRGAPLDQAYKGWAEQGRQHFSQRFSQALAQYAEQVDARGAEPDVREFIGFLDQFYVQTPGGRRHAQEAQNGNTNQTPTEGSDGPESLKEEIAQAVISELKGEKESEEESLADTAARRAEAPTARMPRAPTGARTPRPADEEADLTGMTADQVKDHYKERLKRGSGR